MKLRESLSFHCWIFKMRNFNHYKNFNVQWFRQIKFIQVSIQIKFRYVLHMPIPAVSKLLQRREGKTSSLRFLEERPFCYHCRCNVLKAFCWKSIFQDSKETSLFCFTVRKLLHVLLMMISSSDYVRCHRNVLRLNSHIIS